ncbi:hypothetical protein GF369_04060 [Candidatus Peregrinibacteria bacterium]|nr:hypothetical protein [Candidatus Peregrinibacteria bacterium]
MNWKPLPNEAPAPDKKKKTHISKKFTKHALSKKSSHPNISYRLVQSVSLRLLEYVKKEGKYSLDEVADLITDMQRTIVTLQKKRISLFEKEKEKHKKKKKRRKKKPFNIKKIQ